MFIDWLNQMLGFSSDCRVIFFYYRCSSCDLNFDCRVDFFSYRYSSCGFNSGWEHVEADFGGWGWFCNVGRESLHWFGWRR